MYNFSTHTVFTTISSTLLTRTGNPTIINALNLLIVSYVTGFVKILQLHTSNFTTLAIHTYEQLKQILACD